MAFIQQLARALPPVFDSIGYGAEDGARTHNLLFTKQLLCH